MGEANTHSDRYLSSENRIRGMKARFALPADGEESPFKEINFTELNREEASKVVQQYNGEANKNDYKNKYRRGRLNRSKVTKMPLPPKMQGKVAQSANCFPRKKRIVYLKNL